MCVYAWVPRPRCRCRIPTPRRLAGGSSSARALRWESGPGDGRAEAGAVGARLGVRPAARPGFYPCGRDHGRLCDPTAALQGPSGCCREWPGAQGSGWVSEAMLFMSNRASRQVKGPRICERGSPLGLHLHLHLLYVVGEGPGLGSPLGGARRRPGETRAGG